MVAFPFKNVGVLFCTAALLLEKQCCLKVLAARKRRCSALCNSVAVERNDLKLLGQIGFDLNSKADVL